MSNLLRNMLLKVPSPSKGLFLRGMSTTIMNEDYVQTILQNYYMNNSIVVSNVQKSAACEKGDSYVSNVSRIEIRGYKNSDQIKQVFYEHLIIKEVPASEQRDLYRSTVAMANESNAYNHIVPTLKKYFVGPLVVPECIYADNDVIILHDLCQQGYTPVKKLKEGMSLRQCEIVLEGLARLHAASLVCKHKEPEEFYKLTSLVKELLYHDHGESHLLNHQNSLIQNVVDVFKKLPNNEENRTTISVLQHMQNNSRGEILQLLSNPPEHSVICHGDAWLGNIMFNGTNDMKLIDLQLMRFGSVASDLSYFLHINLPPNIRIPNTEALLGLYLYALRQNTKKMGVNMDNILTKEWLDNEMKMFSTYGVIFGMWVTPVFFLKTDNIEISQRSLKSERSVQRDDPECQERLKELILGYVRSL